MDARNRWRVVRVALTAIYLMGGWMLFSDIVDRASLMIGAVFSLFIALLTYDAFIDESEASWRGLLPRLHWGVAFLLVLLLKIYAASFRVLVLVLRGGACPRVVHFRTRLRSDIARVVLANALTITPGTIALDLDEDHLIVHWLDARTSHSRQAHQLIAADLERLIGRIWV